MTDLQQFLINHLTEKILEHERRNSPRGIFWPEQHAEICKAAERITRQQRRHVARSSEKSTLETDRDAVDIARGIAELILIRLASLTNREAINEP